MPILATVEEAREIVTTFEHGSDEIRGDEDVSDGVVHHPSRVVGHDALAG